MHKNIILDRREKGPVQRNSTALCSSHLSYYILNGREYLTNISRGLGSRFTDYLIKSPHFRHQRSRLEIWNRKLYDGTYAVAFVSQRDDGIPYAASFTADEMQLPKGEYQVQVSIMENTNNM